MNYKTFVFLLSGLFMVLGVSGEDHGIPVRRDTNEASSHKVLMDFDFTDIGGKDKVTDKTGNYTLFSDCGTLLEEEDALRVAFGARLRIPCPDRAFGEKFTISTWLVKSAKLEVLEQMPILSRGFMQPYARSAPGRGKFDFALSINCYVPEFKTIFGGLTTQGVPYNQAYAYTQLKWQKNSPKELFNVDRYMHVVAVYETGVTRIYLNGQLIAENQQETNEEIMTSDQPLYLGAFRVEGEEDNQLASEMLIKSLRVESGALTDSEINAMYKVEKTTIPTDIKYSLALTRHYYSKEMLPNDPEMKTRLKITTKYLNELPAASFQSNPTMTASYSSSPRDLRLLVNGVSVSPTMACAHVWDSRENVHDEFRADFVAAGVDTHRVAVRSDQMWPDDEKYDFSLLDERIRRAIAINSKVKICVGICLSPPPWFYEKHSDELAVYYVNVNDPLAGMKTWTGYGGPLGSDLWLEKSCQMLRNFVKHVENAPYSNHVFNYHISGGDAGEWYWPGQFAGMPGYSIPTRNNFRKYLVDKYHDNNQLLQEAWQDEKVTFDVVEAPSPKERNATENGLFRDPKVATKCNDFRDFINARTLLNINESSRIIREIAGKEKIITTYCGYSLYYAGRGLLHVSGLQHVSDVLKSPYIDSIATPLDYHYRRGGETGVNIAGFNGTAQLNKKMIWREEDLRTHLFPRLMWGRTSTLDETLSVISRDYGYTMAENYGMWYVCQGEMHGWHQDEIMEHIAHMQKLSELSASKKRTDVAEVALIFDEKNSLSCLAGPASSFVTDHIWGVYQKAHSMGAPFKLYFIDDLARPDMPDYKLYVFLNPWHINSNQREMILQKINKNNAVSVWNYAPGYVSDSGFELKNMKKLTGFEFIEKRQPLAMSASSVSFSSHTLNNGVTQQPVENSFSPYFGIHAERSEILAEIDDVAIMGAKKIKDHRSVWTLLPLSIQQLINLCDYAGVHVYSRDGDLLLANDSYVLFHSAKDGKHTITLPAAKNVTEVITDKNFGNTKEFVVDCKKGTTSIFQIDSL